MNEQIQQLTDEIKRIRYKYYELVGENKALRTVVGLPERNYSLDKHKSKCVIIDIKTKKII